MESLKKVSTKELVIELNNRPGVRSIKLEKEESYKVQAARFNNTRDRYLKGNGPATILEVVD